MTNIIVLISAILSLLVPIIDFIQSKISAKHEKKENINFQIGTQQIQVNGQGNVSVQGNRNNIKNQAVNIYQNTYPQSTTYTNNNNPDGIVLFLISVAVIVFYATFKAYIVTSVILLNLIQIILIKLSSKYIKPKVKLLFYFATIISTFITIIFIQNGLREPIGYITYLHNINFNGLIRYGFFHEIVYAFSNRNFLYYLLIELIVMIFYIIKSFYMIKDLLKPILYNLTNNHFNWISEKTQPQRQVNFEKTIKVYIRNSLIFAFFSIIFLAYIFQLIALLNKVISLLFLHIKSIKQQVGKK